MLMFKSREFKKVKHKAMILRGLYLDKVKRELIQEYCNEMGYTCTIDNDMPVITSNDGKKHVFIQQSGDDYWAVESVPVFDKKHNIVSYQKVMENLSDILLMFNLLKVQKIKTSKLKISQRKWEESLSIKYFTSDLVPSFNT